MLTTARLVLRQWRKEDERVFIAMNMDMQVMQYFPSVQSAVQSKAAIAKMSHLINNQGWGLWAVELIDTQEFIGFIGLHALQEGFEFTPCVEIGWRISPKFWNKGYATEGARAALAYGFKSLGLNAIVAFTPKLNLASQKVMRKIGMTQIKEFKHPKLATNPELELCVLYRICAIDTI